MFSVGQHVVCIDASSGYGEWDECERLFEGAIYTVESIHLDHFNVPVLWLAEVVRSADSVREFGPKAGYCISRFRPLVTKKTDISIFKKMLTPAVEDV